MPAFSVIAGIVVTSILIALLALSRIFSAPEVEVLELTSVETVLLEEPPPPPDLSEPEEPDDLPPPPAPKLELTPLINQLDAPEVALSLKTIDLTTPVEAFHTDSAPAKLPVVRKPTPRPTSSKPKTTTSRPTTTRPTSSKPKVTRPVVKKAYYSTGELDSLPRAIRTGSFTWPSRARGTSGTVRLLLEISESGKVRVISVVSSTDSHLSAAASRVARGSRFTSPRKNGQKVKARFYKNYVLKKP